MAPQLMRRMVRTVVLCTALAALAACSTGTYPMSGHTAGTEDPVAQLSYMGFMHPPGI